MSSSVAKKYSYRSSVGRTTGGSADISIEYSADLSALTRLEVSWSFPGQLRHPPIQLAPQLPLSGVGPISLIYSLCA